MRAGPERTRALETVLDEARRMAAEMPLAAAEVLRWLREGSDEQRVTALAIMQARPELRDFDAMLETIAGSRSAFEQYHAMVLAAAMADDPADDLDEERRRRLAGTITAQRGRFGDGDRPGLGDHIMSGVGRHR